MNKYLVTFYDYWNPRPRVQFSLRATNKRAAYGLAMSILGSGTVLCSIRGIK